MAHNTLVLATTKDDKKGGNSGGNSVVSEGSGSANLALNTDNETETSCLKMSAKYAASESNSHIIHLAKGSPNEAESHKSLLASAGSIL